MISSHDIQIIPNQLGSFCVIDDHIPSRSELPYSLQLNDETFLDPFGHPVIVKRIFLNIDSSTDLTLFDIQLSSFSLNLSF